MNEKDVEAFQSKLRLSNNFQTANTLKKTSPFDHLYNTNEADAIEIILKSMYGPNVDDYNWIGLSDDKFEIVEKSLERFLNLRGKWLEVEIAKYAKPQNVAREIEPIKLSKPKKLFKLSDLPLLALGVPISIVLLGLFLQSIPLTISIFASLFLSPYSIISAIFVLVFGLLGEGADGFKKGWWERLLGNYYFLTLILAFIGEFVTPVLGFEPYLL
jgi:hypothetical protein